MEKASIGLIIIRKGNLPVSSLSSTTKRSNSFYGLLMLIGIIAISFSSIFIKWSSAPVSVIGMYRLAMTCAILSPFLIRHRAEIRRISFRQWLLLTASGLALGLHFLFWMGSLRYTSVASSTAIVALEPVLVMLGSYWAFREKNHPLAVIGMLIAIGGAVLIGWGDFGLSSRNLYGDLLSFIGTVAVVIHVLLGSKLRETMSTFVYSFFVFLLGAGVLMVYNLFLGYSFTGYASRDWGMFFLLAAVPTLFGHYLFNWLLKYLRASTVSMSILGEPVGSTILAYFLLDESVTILQGSAGFLLLAGVWLFMKGNTIRVGELAAESREATAASAAQASNNGTANSELPVS
ncbi:DMT family transporter [Gorillibacterium timonense]|uniref:DMT family transporter n=1 Tax=Gorillibacterium timonense TaxID=1689269 RepID=UPI0009E8B1C0|nr:DMT family transporter [Gorillibacterium timonense]